jgi:hypothetical protein
MVFLWRLANIDLNNINVDVLIVRSLVQTEMNVNVVCGVGDVSVEPSIVLTAVVTRGTTSSIP